MAHARGESARAARLFAAVEALRKEIDIRVSHAGSPNAPHFITAIRTELDETSFAAAWGEGGAMTLEQAVEYALYSSGISANCSIVSERSSAT
ncbi:MAG: hypothetical protein M3220_16715 [Chloroflexota bacterium]|nr:hypothetical protein [Chloroflexota bacterium]